MRKSLFIILFLYTFFVNAQNITVDSQTYTPQQLIENILIDSDCIANVQVTNVVGGDFNNTDQSYGFFDATGTTFPFQSGVILSTGRLNNVPGPNNSLSDDNAPNWNGDNDLEVALQETNTTNATIIEFDFTSVANQISFRYIFASEEYQEGNANTCNFSDLFGFLIRPASNTQYQNIALVPNTQTPVKVTTVHPGISGSCDPINETYFGSYNNTVSPINFNGQTTILTATAQTIPNENYHVKLVIADEQNFRFDSAVFLEAGSFELTTDLGLDRLIATNNPLCGNETLTLSAFLSGNNDYTWFKDNTPFISFSNDGNGSSINVTEAGTYGVEIVLDNGCISYGEIIIEYAPNPISANSTLSTCDIDQDGLSIFNLNESSQAITANESDLNIIGFYTNLSDAEQQINAINDPEVFENTIAMQTIFVVSQSEITLCSVISEITLSTTMNTINFSDFNTCDDDLVDGFTTFNLNDVRDQIATNAPANSTFEFYTTLNDAFTETNVLPTNFTNTVINSQTIFVKISLGSVSCYALSEITLNVLFTPQLLPNESVLYCINSFPETITLAAGVTNNIPSNQNYQWLFNGIDTGVNTSSIVVNEIGTYTITATGPNGCFNTREITVFPSNEPTIEDLIFTELTANNTATITVSGEGEYDFAIDNEFGFYQEENTFSNIEPGFHTIYVRDRRGCGNASINFSILGFPQYFTPNGDDSNEVWKPIGANQDFNNDLNILIFNRYGKLLAQPNPIKGWNGTYNGYNLPSDDYWYIINHPNGKQYKGHFALIR